MKRSLKIAVTVAVLIVALLGLTLIAAEPVLNSIAVKSQIENIVGETLDMSFKIEGRIKLRFLPFLSVVVNKINVSTSQGKIASADRIEIDPRLPDSLFLKVHLEDVHIHNPQLTFDPHALDKVLALAGEGSDEPLPVKSLVIDSFSISKAKFFYSDTQSVVDLNEMNIDGGPIAIIEDRKVIIDDVASFFRAFNFKGEMSAQQIVSQDFKLTNIKAQVQDENGILTFDPIELEYLGSSTKIAGKLDLSRKMPTAQLRLETSASDIKRLAAWIFPDVEFRGAMKVITDITATGLEFKNLIGRLQAISQSDRSVEEVVFPVNKVMIKPIMVSASNLKFTKDTTKVDNAKVELTANRLSVVEKNRLAIKDLKTFLRNARFDARTQIKNISVQNQKFDNIRLSMRGDRGILKSDSIELDYFGARTKIEGLFNLQDNLNRLKVRIEMPKVDLEKSFKESVDTELVKGVVNLQAEIEARAALFTEIPKNMNGYFSIKGKNLRLKGVDLDKALDEFKKISSYGFNDFSALLLLGPLGTIVSHGYDQLEALEKMMKATGDSAIKQVVSDWKVAKNVFTAVDVAFSTQRNRVGVKGSLDIANKKFKNVTIAVVDPNGCIVNSETVDGPFENPEIKESGLIERTLVRPLKRFLKTDCNFFYKGAVPHPSGQ